jgi:hypothetical protein
MLAQAIYHHLLRTKRLLSGDAPKARRRGKSPPDTKA